MLLSLLLQSALTASLSAVPVSSGVAGDSLELHRIEPYQMISFEAEDAQKTYDFAKAVEKWREALSECRDSSAGKQISLRISECENGLNMKDFAYRPEVVARRRFSILDFQLYYPLPDNAWRPVPNQLDSTGAIPYSAAVYAPEGALQLFFSAPDSSGVRTIWETHFADSAWTMPAKTGCGQGAIYPMECGQDLYFASDCLYGVGGYDIYVARWNPAQRRWGAPQNLGFPFCSPQNDYLYTWSSDGRYAVFASDRDCPIDSVNVYVVKKEDLPVRQPVSGIGELRELCSLTPVRNGEGKQGPQDPAIMEYRQKLLELYSLRDSLAGHSGKLEAMRARYSGAAPRERESLSSEIMALESRTPQMQARLNEASQALAALEEELLAQGMIVDRAGLEAHSETPAKKYEFHRNHRGKPLKLKFF